MAQKDKSEEPHQAELGPMKVEITPEMVRRWTDATGDQNPWHSEESPFGGAIVPPALLFGLSIKLRYDSGIQSWPEGDDAVQVQYNLHTNRPIKVGEKLTVTGRLMDRYEKRQREYFVWDIRFRDEAGEEVARYEHIDLETYLKKGGR
ncbi:MAG: MaoC family dehydratase [Dehalococcoidia bacterium]